MTNRLRPLILLPALLTSVITDTSVTALYSCDDIQTLSVCTAILNGEAAGVTYWTNILNGGTSRAAVTLLFSQSPEFKILTKIS